MSISNDDIVRAALELRAESRARTKMCPAGEHDMETHGRQIWKTMPDGHQVMNGRYCIGCKRKRQRDPAAAERPNAQKPRT